MSTRLHAKPRVSPSTALVCALLFSTPAVAAEPATLPPPAPTQVVASSTDQADDAPVVTFAAVRVHGLQPTSLPTRIPTKMEGITREEIQDKINASDAQDVLKYFPSLLVRKRFIGDFDHAVLATRASGTGNSARSLVYADGILLSNLLGNGASFTPRWGLVGPEEIDRVDVLYGPFSAAYSGNSVGAVVDYVTRMPDRLEGHVKYGYFLQNFDLFGTHEDFAAKSLSASLGNRWGRYSAWLSVNRLDSDAHPIAFATLPDSAGIGTSGTAVTGAIAGRNPVGQPWQLIGATGQTNTVQDQAKLKLAFDLAPDLRLSYVAGWWNNDVFRNSETYLRDAQGDPVHSGNVLIDGRGFTVSPTAVSLQHGELEHLIQGLSLKRNSGGRWDYTVALSRYDYVVDQIRTPLVARPAADTGGAGRIADSSGNGWTTASAMVIWRPDTRHVVEFGLQDDRYELATVVSNTADWISGAAQSRFSAFEGTTELRSLFVQDTWSWSPRWTSMLGVRLEQWTASDGLLANATTELDFAGRRETAVSPKAAIQFALNDDVSIKASFGRAIRFPTVSELYQGTIANDEIVNNNPNLQPERSNTSELSWVQRIATGRLRATVFHERTRDALYSQTNVTVTPRVTNIQNVDSIRTTGLELAAELNGVGLDDLDVISSVTFADSIVRANDNFPDSVGKWQPRVPRWRANVLATWHPGDHWSFTGGVRYSGRQFNRLDNLDVNANTWTGTSTFLVADARVRYRHDDHWSGALGVDNLTDRTYWTFHPFNQRTWVAELRFDY
ncbi:MAG: TonB-dependent receptor [Pseudomonadota bacterium]|nr:TonB-dependent receptor [Pseudomonadota bacterium]